MPYSPVHKHCTPVKNLKGKTTGLMMEGLCSVYVNAPQGVRKTREKRFIRRYAS